MRIIIHNPVCHKSGEIVSRKMAGLTISPKVKKEKLILFSTPHSSLKELITYETTLKNCSGKKLLSCHPVIRQYEKTTATPS